MEHWAPMHWGFRPSICILCSPSVVGYNSVSPHCMFTLVAFLISFARGWAGGVASVVCPPPWWWCVQSHVQYPVLAPGSSEVAVGVFFVSFYLFAHNLPQLCMPMQAVIFDPLQFLCILFLKDMFVQVHTLPQKVPGPRLSQWHNLPQRI